MGENRGKTKIYQHFKRTLRLLGCIWFLTLLSSPIAGLVSILMLSCAEIGASIDWDASFTGKKQNRSPEEQ